MPARPLSAPQGTNPWAAFRRPSSAPAVAQGQQPAVSHAAAATVPLLPTALVLNGTAALLAEMRRERLGWSEWAGLLYPVTDNRLTLMTILDVWKKYATEDGYMDKASFATAFAEAAKSKYFYSVYGSLKGRSRLLLRQVYAAYCARPPKGGAQLGPLLHMIRKDVAELICSRHAILTNIFGASTTTCEDQGAAAPVKDAVDKDPWATAVSCDLRMSWTAFLSCMAETGLAPEHVSPELLQQAFSGAQSAPHRLSSTGRGLDDDGEKYSYQQRAVSALHFPQFLEAISFVATEAAASLDLDLDPTAAQSGEFQLASLRALLLHLQATKPGHIYSHLRKGPTHDDQRGSGPLSSDGDDDDDDDDDYHEEDEGSCLSNSSRSDGDTQSTTEGRRSVDDSTWHTVESVFGGDELCLAWPDSALSAAPSHGSSPRMPPSFLPVVMKEVLPIPSHCPGEAAAYLRTSFHHQRFGKFSKALAGNEAARTAWRSEIGAELEIVDDSFLLIAQASIQQSAFNDEGAIQALLRATSRLQDDKDASSSEYGKWLLDLVLGEVGVVSYYAEKTHLAAQCFLRLCRHRTEQHGCEHAASASALANLGASLSVLGMGCDASNCLITAYRRLSKALGEHHPRTRTVLRSLSVIQDAGKSVGRSKLEGLGLEPFARVEPEVVDRVYPSGFFTEGVEQWTAPLPTSSGKKKLKKGKKSAGTGKAKKKSKVKPKTKL
jgi:hypothetical protein